MPKDEVSAGAGSRGTGYKFAPWMGLKAGGAVS